MRAHVTLMAIAMALCSGGAASAQNVLVNGNFESNPPPHFSNNIDWSILPWVLGPGPSSANVVKVDGPGGFDYGSDGPESDASAPGAGIPQHYLDIVGSNTFYQSFTPQCSGHAIFGGSFSTRANAAGEAQVALREGIGTTGTIVGTSNTVLLPVGNSKTDPWTLVSFTATITASVAYSLVITMDDNLNFDNGFVTYEADCQPDSVCTMAPMNMVAWWPMDDDIQDGFFGPVVAKDVIGGHDGAGAFEAQRAGEVGGSLCNPTEVTLAPIVIQDSPQLDFGPDSPPGTGDFSIDAWIKPYPAVPDVWILRKIGGNGVGYGLELSGGQLNFTMSDATGPGHTVYRSNAPTPIPFDMWTHIAVCVDRDAPDGVAFYINGEPAGATTPPAPVNIDNNANVEMASTPICLDEVELFDRALTLEEVVRVFRAGARGKCRANNASIRGKVFNDLNRDGVWQAGEPGLPYWTVNVDRVAPGGQHRMAIDDASGIYAMGSCVPGSYTASVVPQWGWNSSKGFSDPWVFTLADGEVLEDISFGLWQCAVHSPCFWVHWGAVGPEPGRFRHPENIFATSWRGRGDPVLVGDFDNNRVQVFTAMGEFIAMWGSAGTGPGQFNGVSAVAADHLDNVYVADYLNHRIQKFTSAGVFLTAWGSEGSGDGQFQRPDGLAVDGVDNIYVTDSFNHRLQKFTSDGAFLAKWGSFGTGDGQFNQPACVALDSTGNVYVTDSNNHRIEKFTSSGAFLAKWGAFGTGPGQFNTPQGISVDHSGRVFVADYFNNRVEWFTGEGGYLGQWGSLGSGDEQFTQPSDVAIGPAGNIYVAEWGGNRISAFSSVASDSGVGVSCGAPPNGLVAWWPLDELTGLVAADVAGTANATYVGSSTHVTGKVGNALHLASDSDYLAAADQASLNFGTGNFSVAAWVRSADTSAPVRTILDKRTGDPYLGYSFYISYGHLGVQLADGSGFTNFSSSSGTVTDGSWHHVVATIDRGASGSGGTLYRDGAIIATFDPGSNPGTLTNLGPLRIGQAFDGSSSQFNGDIDEVQLYNRALSAEEVVGLVHSDTAGTCKPAIVDVPRAGVTSGQNFIELSNNPLASGNAQVRFGLARTDRVEIRVFDISGRLLRTLVDRQFIAGEHSVTWDGTDDLGRPLASGVYFARVSFHDSGFRAAPKLVILR